MSSELAEAIQIIALTGRAAVGAGTVMYKTGELGVKTIKAILLAIEKRRLETLSGEVSFDKLNRFEGGHISIARFRDLNIDDLRPLLDQYGVAYAVMPSTDVNGIHYTQISFGYRNSDRINAIIQSLEGRGEVVTANTQPPYIESGEVSLDVLLNQDGQCKIYRFSEAGREQIMAALESYKVKYTVMPDLNVHDGMFEIAIPPKQQELLINMLKKIGAQAAPITMEEYTQNADNALVSNAAAEYDRLHILPSDFVTTAENDTAIEISAPRAAVLDLEENEKAIAPTNLYAIPIPQTEIMADAKDPDKVKLTIKKDQDYKIVWPNGVGETKKGSQLIEDIQIATKAQKEMEKTEKSLKENIEAVTKGKLSL